MDATDLLVWDEESNTKLGVRVVGAFLTKLDSYFDEGDTVWELRPRIQFLDDSFASSLAVEFSLLDQHGVALDTTIEPLRRPLSGGRLMSSRILLFPKEHEAPMVVSAVARVRPSAPHPDNTPLDIPVSSDADALAAAGYTLEVVHATCASHEYSGGAVISVSMRVSAHLGRTPDVTLRAVNTQGLQVNGVSTFSNFGPDPSYPGVYVGIAKLELAEVPTRILLTPSRTERTIRKFLPDISDEYFEANVVEEN